MNYLVLVRNPSFFTFLLYLDLSIVQSTGKAGCRHCGGALDRSDWQRKGFGIPEGCSDEVLTRHSFQCRDCEKRNTPSSLRWMYYRKYSCCIQLLVPALVEKGRADAVAELCDLFLISASLLRRWRLWWRDAFQSTPFWGQHRSLFGFLDLEAISSGLMEWHEKSSKPHGKGGHFTPLLSFLSRYRTVRVWLSDRRACELLWTKENYMLQGS